MSYEIGLVNQVFSIWSLWWITITVGGGTHKMSGVTVAYHRILSSPQLFYITRGNGHLKQACKFATYSTRDG